jgi:FtsZ-binding cell division protein ZapB
MGARVAEVSYASFAQELAAVRSRGDQFQLRAQQAMDGEALLPVALEELRVTEEEVRVQNEQLAEARQSVETQRAHFRSCSRGPRWPTWSPTGSG